MGKKVSVIVELKARFDEEANLYWKSKLEEEGIQCICWCARHESTRKDLRNNQNGGK
jgi:polyphosphate kinase